MHPTAPNTKAAARLLVIDASPRGDRSRSRRLSGLFSSLWKDSFPQDQVILRDAHKQQVPSIDEAWMQAAYTPTAKRTPEQHALLTPSDALVSDWLGSDFIVLATPMYNFSVPACLKAYIDQLFRVGETFRLEKGRYVGLLSGKSAFVITTKGGFYQSHPDERHNDFLTPYLQHVLKTLGFSKVTTFDAEGLDISRPFEEQALSRAQQEFAAAIEDLAKERHS
jgi:FMN-dependent NADH-azoreductase